MHRDGADPTNIAMSDVLCDFCGQPWTDERYLIEGHLGACICQNCLTIAYSDVALHKNAAEINFDEICVLCREHSDERRHWRSPMRDEALICHRCTKQAAGALHKAEDIAWRKPVLNQDQATPSETP